LILQMLLPAAAAVARATRAQCGAILVTPRGVSVIPSIKSLRTTSGGVSAMLLKQMIFMSQHSTVLAAGATVRVVPSVMSYIGAALIVLAVKGLAEG